MRGARSCNPGATKEKSDLVIVILVRATRFDQDVERSPVLWFALERRLGARVLEDHVESLLVEKLERREDLAKVLARLGEDFLHRFEIGHRQDRDVDRLGRSYSQFRRVVPKSVATEGID